MDKTRTKEDQIIINQIDHQKFIQNEIYQLIADCTNKDNLQEYGQIVKEYKMLVDLEDNEASHVIQDTIYRKFITNVADNKFKHSDELIVVAKLLFSAVVQTDVGRWYA